MSFEAVLESYILPLFGTAQVDPEADEEGQLDVPWWWPRGDGSARDHWFGDLSSNVVERAANRDTPLGARRWTERAILTELRRREATRHPHGDYDGFHGSFPTPPRQGMVVMLVSDRPSHSRYWAGGTTTLVGALRRTEALDVCVTDVIKRRGRKSSETLRAGESLTMHGTILLAQLQSLLGGPGVDGVLLVPVQDRTAGLIGRALNGRELPEGLKVWPRPTRFWAHGWTCEFMEDLSAALSSIQ